VVSEVPQDPHTQQGAGVAVLSMHPPASLPIDEDSVFAQAAGRAALHVMNLPNVSHAVVLGVVRYDGGQRPL
jgi:hypothetical protein